MRELCTFFSRYRANSAAGDCRQHNSPRLVEHACMLVYTARSHHNTLPTNTGINDLDAVIQSMKKLRAKWYEVGISLKVDDTFLDELEGKGLSDERAMLKTLKKWLEDYDKAKLGGKPSWRMLARIAGRHRMDVAREIAQNHPINPQSN